MADHFRYDVFLSHNTTDKDAVEEIARKLKSKGIRPWLDKWDLAAGDSIRRKLDGSDLSAVTRRINSRLSGTTAACVRRARMNWRKKRKWAPTATCSLATKEKS